MSPKREPYRRYTLHDVVTQELRPTLIGYAVILIMSDGARREAPSVATEKQARSRAKEWFPQARTIVVDGVS